MSSVCSAPPLERTHASLENWDGATRLVSLWRDYCKAAFDSGRDHSVVVDPDRRFAEGLGAAPKVDEASEEHVFLFGGPVR
jgi:hypothetical protein